MVVIFSVDPLKALDTFVNEINFVEEVSLF